MPNPEKKQYQIIVKGKVQGVGFRDKVEDLADERGLVGSIQNCLTKDVVIHVEGDVSLLNTFTQSIRTLPPPILVKSVDIVELPFEGTFQEFLIIRGAPSDELAERFDSAIGYLHRSEITQEKILVIQEKILDIQCQMIGKQDQMLDKQDTGIGLQRETLNEVTGARSDFQRTFTHELIEIRSEIQELRSAMIQAGYMKKADAQ